MTLNPPIFPISPISEACMPETKYSSWSSPVKLSNGSTTKDWMSPARTCFKSPARFSTTNPIITTKLTMVAIFQAFGTCCLSPSSTSLKGLVFSTPSEVRSNSQDKMIAIGNPTARTTITMVGRLGGRFSGSARLLTSSMITKDAEAYTVITCMTFRLFNSCQNWDSLEGVLDMVQG